MDRDKDRARPGELIDLAERHQRRLWYEEVLIRGLREEIEQFIDGALLIDLFPDLELSPAIRKRWQALIDQG